LQLPVVGLKEDRVLELVDPVIEGGEHREEAVDQPIDNSVQQERRLLKLLASLIAAADLGEGGAVFAMDGDEESLGVEAMHLDEPVVVWCSAVDDDKEEVVVLVNLGALVELLRVFDFASE